MGKAISSEVQKVIIGKSHVIDNVMVDILSNGNLLFEVSWTCKNLDDKYIRRCFGVRFQKSSVPPDLPADITGTNIYDAKKGEFSFKPGPIFCNLLLSDEMSMRLLQNSSGPT